MTEKTKAGAYEWGGTMVTIADGCGNKRCRYCYAAEMACRLRGFTTERWSNVKVRQKDVDMPRPLYKEQPVFFQSASDITPEILSESLCVLNKLLDAGNEVLIVSKPRWQCITTICERFKAFQKQILFRFTIGSLCDKTLQFWEPGAPNLDERLSCLRYAFESGYQTSVSAEPFLDESVEALYRGVKDLITESFWIGKMNKWKQRCNFDDCGFVTKMHYVKLMLEFQTDEAIMRLCNKLKDEPLVKWKDSIQKVISRKP